MCVCTTIVLVHYCVIIALLLTFPRRWHVWCRTRLIFSKLNPVNNTVQTSYPWYKRQIYFLLCLIRHTVSHGRRALRRNAYKRKRSKNNKVKSVSCVKREKQVFPFFSLILWEKLDSQNFLTHKPTRFEPHTINTIPGTNSTYD